MSRENAVTMKVTIDADLLPDLYQRLAALSGRKRQLLIFKYLSAGELAIHGGGAPQRIVTVTRDTLEGNGHRAEEADQDGELAAAFLDFSDSFTTKPN